MRALKVIGSTPARPTVIHTLSEFVTLISTYAEGEDRLKCYRGQMNIDWDAVPGIFRSDLVRLQQHEKRAIRDLISVHPGEFADDHTMFDRLVRMQHFGLPTRLMDVSLNPLVALYFATEPTTDGAPTDGLVSAFAIPEEREKYYDSDAVSCQANLANLTASEKTAIVDIRAKRPPNSPLAEEREHANDQEVYKRLHQFVRVEKPYFLPIIDPIDLFKPYYVHPKRSNRRIVAQSGGFIIYGLVPPRTINFAHAIAETRFSIPHPVKSAIRASLDLLGINESTLFPELDRAAKRITSVYSD